MSYRQEPVEDFIFRDGFLLLFAESRKDSLPAAMAAVFLSPLQHSPFKIDLAALRADSVVSTRWA